MFFVELLSVFLRQLHLFARFSYRTLFGSLVFLLRIMNFRDSLPEVAPGEVLYYRSRFCSYIGRDQCKYFFLSFRFVFIRLLFIACLS